MIIDNISPKRALELHFEQNPEDGPKPLAERCGVHWTTIYNIMRGENFNWNTWEKIKPELNVQDEAA